MSNVVVCDSNHLISVDDEGFFHCGGSDGPYAGGEGIDDSALAALPNIDFITYHLYPASWGETDAWGINGLVTTSR